MMDSLSDTPTAGCDWSASVADVVDVVVVVVSGQACR